MSKDGQAEIAGMPTAADQGVVETGGAARPVRPHPVIAAYEIELGSAAVLSGTHRGDEDRGAEDETGKGPGGHRGALRIDGRAEAAELGWDGLGVQREIGRASRPPQRTAALVEQLDRAAIDAVRAAGARRAVFSRSDLAAEVATRLPTGGFDANLVRTLIEKLTDQALSTPGAVTLRPEIEGCHRGSDARYASRSTLDAELRILGIAEVGRSQGVAVVDPREVRAIARRRGLDASQQAALVQVAGSGDAVSVLVAPAGTGKTTALGAAVYAWHAAGYRIVGLGPSARAAAELRDATFAPADTVAKFLHEHQKPPSPFVLETGRYRLHPGTVVIVDEASMLATTDLDALTRASWEAGAKLLLVGDPAQIGAVDAAGGMLPALARRLDAPTLDTVHRFTEAWERRASLRLRAGDRTVIDDYIAAGRVHHCPDDTAAYQAVLDSYLDASTAGRRVLMLARTHHDVDTLNTLARAHAIETGQVHGPILLDGPTQWRAGDRLRATRNNRTITVGEDYLRNGDQFVVLNGDRDGLLVQTLDGSRAATLPADYVIAHTTYGWASTIDAAQGATVDDAVLLARPGIDREHLYVGLTRGRNANHVVVAQPISDIDRHGLPKAGVPRAARAMLADALNASGLQKAAHTRLPEHLQIEPATPATRPRPMVRRPRPARAPLQRIERPQRSMEPDHHYRGLSHDHELGQDRDFGSGR